MKLTIDVPDKIAHRETHIASMETDRKGLKARLEKQWRKYLRRSKPLVIPIRCEFCAHVNEAQWCERHGATHFAAPSRPAIG